MARRKRKTEEVDTTTEVETEVEAQETEEEVEVTEEFILQEVEDVSDVTDSYETIMEEGLVDLDATEVEAAIEDGAPIVEVEEFKQAPAPIKAKRNRTTVDTKVDASKILKEQKQKEADEAVLIENKKNQARQRMARVKPVISQAKKNNGIRTSSGLFSR